MKRTLPKPTAKELRDLAETFSDSGEQRLEDSVNFGLPAEERDGSLDLRREDLLIQMALEQWANAIDGGGK